MLLSHDRLYGDPNGPTEYKEAQETSPAIRDSVRAFDSQNIAWPGTLRKSARLGRFHRVTGLPVCRCGGSAGPPSTGHCRPKYSQILWCPDLEKADSRR